MSSYLELCQKFARVTGITGAAIPSVTGLTGMNLKIVGWIADADIDIQGEYQDWKFLDILKAFDTVADKDTYSLADLGITDMNSWDVKRFFINPGLANYRKLNEFDYYEWLESRQRLGVKVSKEPTQIVIMSDYSIVLVDKPDEIYTIWGRYFRVPTRMVANEDISAIPTTYEMAILYRAKKYYAEYYEHWDLYKSANTDLEKEMIKLEAQQLTDQKEKARGANDAEDLVTVPE